MSTTSKVVVGMKRRGALRDQGKPATRMGWSSDGKLLAVPSIDGFVRVCDTKTLKSIRSLKLHPRAINAVSWSPNNRQIAAGAESGDIFIWDLNSGEVVKTIREDDRAIYSVAWSPNGATLAAGSQNHSIRLWNTSTWQPISDLSGHSQGVNALAWYPDGHTLASASYDWRVRIWNINSVRESDKRTTERTRVIMDWQIVDSDIFDWGSWSKAGKSWLELQGHSAGVNCLAMSSRRLLLATGGDDRVIRIWNALTTSCMQILEGHTNSIRSISFDAEGALLASQSAEGAIRIWRTDTWETVAKLDSSPPHFWLSSLAFNPKRSLLAVPNDEELSVQFFDLDTSLLLNSDSHWKSVRYANAKVAIIGETGVGKSALGHRLAQREWKPTDGSTHGMNVWLLESQPEREVLLWDFAGQSEYRIIHQLFLQHTAVALLLYDPSRSDDLPTEIDFWDKVLARFQKSLHAKFLVAGRTDVGNVRTTSDELARICSERGYSSHFSTSAKTGERCDDLRDAILKAIQWGNIPTTSSPAVFKRIKDFITCLRDGNRVLVREQEIYKNFCDSGENEIPSLEEFTTVIGHVENVGLVNRLSFGDLVLLKPELLNTYASSVVDAARSNSRGLGCVLKATVLKGDIPLKDSGGLNDSDRILLLHATVELFLRLGLALEQDGYLVFPTKLNRKMPTLRQGVAWDTTYEFDGPAEMVYSTLIVKFFSTKLFALQKLWKNAAEFLSPGGAVCGFQLSSRDDGSSAIKVFTALSISPEDNAIFVKVTCDHFNERQVTAKQQRLYRCSSCGKHARDRHAITNALQNRRERIPCQYCSGSVDIGENYPHQADAREHCLKQAMSIQTASKAALKRSGELVSAAGELRSKRFLDWVGGNTLANVSIVFSDIVDSTSLNNSMGDAVWSSVRNDHFLVAKELVKKHDGYLVKTIGDAVMAAFHNSVAALDFSLDFFAQPGHETVKVRVGVHTGQVQITDDDAFGQHVNMAARVGGFTKGSGVVVSSRVRDDVAAFDPNSALRWHEHPNIWLKGFTSTFTLWSVERRAS